MEFLIWNCTSMVESYVEFLMWNYTLLELILCGISYAENFKLLDWIVFGISSVEFYAARMNIMRNFLCRIARWNWYIYGT